MRGSTATEAKNKFGQLLEQANIEPIAIEKAGRRVAVIISAAEYERLAALEDRIWGEKALKALNGVFESEKDAKNWLKRKMNAEADAESRSKKVP